MWGLELSVLAWVVVLADPAAPAKAALQAKPEKVVTLAGLRKLAADYNKPLSTRLTAAKREKAVAGRKKRLPVGQKFRLEGQVVDVVPQEDKKTYRVTVVWHSRRTMKYQAGVVGTGGGSTHVITTTRTRPLERIELQFPSDAAAVGLEKGQAVTVEGTIESIEIKGQYRPRWFEISIEAKARARPGR